MKQLTQKLKDGKMQVLEVPPPVLSSGMVLVKNHYSLISVGTEGNTVSAARKSLIGKARERPQQVKQVLNLLNLAPEVCDSLLALGDPLHSRTITERRLRILLRLPPSQQLAALLDILGSEED